MKKLYLLMILGWLLPLSSICQNLIAVQNGGNPKFFTDLGEAVTNAQAKDTIYIPGGIFSLSSSLIINKEIHLVGVGHHPDSTIVTRATIIKANSNIYLCSGASNSSLEGLYLQIGSIITGTSGSNDDVDNIKFVRCNLGWISLSGNSSNWLICENVISQLYGQGNGGLNSHDNYISNNILKQTVNFDSGNLFRNNIFLNQSYTLQYIKNSIFENNIILGQNWVFDHVIDCSIDNNIFIISNLAGNMTGVNNIFDQVLGLIFINQTGETFDYSQDYHLTPDSPGKNAGRDGTDIGIYGGAFPWKDGSIPSNPHFQKAMISPITDTNGNLNVKIKVAAQDR